MTETICRICKRPLKNINSVLMGIGPVCSGRQHITRGRKSKDEQGELMFDNHAVFGLQEETDQYIYIVDRGNHHNCKTVTNDVEWVLQELADLHDDFGNKRVFYMDSEGRIDEIVHEGNRFIQFKAGHEGITL